MTRKLTTYAFCNLPRNGKPRRTMLLHRFIVDAPAALMVDHVNGDGLDNTRSNLRLATNAQNSANMRRRPRGTYPSGHGKWVARIRHGGRNLYLGTFTTEAEARVAYERAAIELRGEFANVDTVHSVDGTALGRRGWSA